MPSPRRGLSPDRRLLIGLAVAAILMAGAYLWLHETSQESARPSLAHYALLAGNVLVLVAVVFSLLRYTIRLLAERRAGILGARFRFKLVATFFGLSLVPATLLYVAAVYILLAAVESALRPDIDEMVLHARVVKEQFYDDAKADLAADARAFARVVEAELQAGSSPDLAFRLRPRLEAAGIGACRIELFESGSALHVGVPGLIGKRSPLDPVDLPAVQLASDLEEIGRSGQVKREQEIGSRSLFFISGAPLLHDSGETIGAVLVARRLPADLRERVARLGNMADEYARVRQQEPWVKAEHLLNFAWLSLVVILGATWVGFTVARGITVPIQRLAEGTVELRHGNLAHVVDWEGRDELAQLVTAFNEMAADLRAQAAAVERNSAELQQANAKLETMNEELERRRAHMLVMLETMTAGVIAVGADGRVVLANGAARQILELPEGGGAGEPVERLLAAPALAELRAEVAQALQRRFVRRERATILPLGRGDVHLQVVLASQPDPGGGRGLLAIFEDVTELVRAQKLATWRQAARRIAHEIKNPLTPIQLAAQRILKKYREGAPDLPEALESGVQTIVTEVAGLKQMVDEFSHFARMPVVKPAAGSLGEMLVSVQALYRGHENLDVEVDADPALPDVPFDHELLRRAIVNLVDNAVEATGGAGRIELAARLDTERGLACLSVADDGPGVPAADRDQLFLPYFTTRAQGTGLGLAIVHRIVADHGGRVRAETNVPRGARFIIELPLEGAPGGAHDEPATLQQEGA